MGDSLEVRDLGLNTTSGHQSPRGTIIGLHYDDPPFVVLTETKFSFRCIPVWDLYSPHWTRVEKKSKCDNALTMTAPVPWFLTLSMESDLA